MADSTERRPAMRTVVEPAVTEQPAPKPQTQAAAPNKTGRKVAVAIDTPVEKPPAKPKPPAQQHVVSQAAPSSLGSTGTVISSVEGVSSVPSWESARTWLNRSAGSETTLAPLFSFTWDARSSR